jgi:hypothetical protein
VSPAAAEAIAAETSDCETLAAFQIAARSGLTLIVRLVIIRLAFMNVPTTIGSFLVALGFSASQLIMYIVA